MFCNFHIKAITAIFSISMYVGQVVSLLQLEINGNVRKVNAAVQQHEVVSKCVNCLSG
jgi:hypothetical protein